LIDEVKPKIFWRKVLYFIIRIPLALITFIKTHVSTKSLEDIEKRLQNHSFIIIEEKLYLLDSLKIIRSKKIITK